MEDCRTNLKKKEVLFTKFNFLVNGCHAIATCLLHISYRDIHKTQMLSCATNYFSAEETNCFVFLFIKYAYEYLKINNFIYYILINN